MNSRPKRTSPPPESNNEPTDQHAVSRRDAIKTTLAVAGATAFGVAAVDGAEESKSDERRVSPKRYAMKKSINLWAFPYPQRMSLQECMQLAKDAGFDGIELNYDLENDLSPKAGSREFHGIRKMADDIGIAISGLCSFLYWPYSLTSNDAGTRTRGLELATKMFHAAHDLGIENRRVVPGAAHI